MKKVLHFKSLLLLAAMLLGASSTWAEEKTENVNFNNGVFDTDHTTWTVGAGITIFSN